MPSLIRLLEAEDIPAVVELSLRAWTPSFESQKEVVGPEIYDRLHPDWRAEQQRDVEDACRSTDKTVWVADVDGAAVGFVAALLLPERNEGEIWMLAVDPDHQNRGIGSALTVHAEAWIKEAGMAIAVVETGGDRGHAAARRTYEKAGYTPLPNVRYFKAL